VRHEQAAAHAADGLARATGGVGVCFATSGPGATNLVTGIACASMDSIPVVAITGGVTRNNIGKDAFQEADITGITLPITKHNYLVLDVADLARVIKEAFYIARTGRPGPVLVDIPKDVLQEITEFNYPGQVSVQGYKPSINGHPSQIKKAGRLINESRRPVIIAGHGVIISQAYGELKDLAEKAQVPVVTTLLGVSSFPTDHVLSLGMGGMHGTPYASLTINRADVVIALGIRFDDRLTGKPSAYIPNAKVIHIDIDPAELGKNIKPDVPIVGDLKRVLEVLNQHVERISRFEWLQEIEEVRKEHPLRLRDTTKLLPQYILKEISRATDGHAMVVTGVGQHQMWAAQYFTFKDSNSWITSGGAGAMGFELPAAVGAQLGRPDLSVWSIAGDGGFQMTMYELATMVENQLPVKIAIINNKNLGMVRQLQKFFYDKNFVAIDFPGNPDFVKLAEAYGILGLRVTDREQVVPTVKKALEHKGPVVIDFVVDPEEYVYPTIPSGQTVAEMIEEPMQELVQ